MAASDDDFIDYYKLLEVAEDAKTRDILKKYRKIALKMHPDRNPDDPDADSKFAIVVEAKSVLCDESARRKYDLKYKEYKARLERRAQTEARWQSLDANLRSMRADLDARERFANDPMNNAEIRNKHYKNMKKDAIRDELLKFRNLLKTQKMESQNKAKLEKKQTMIQKNSILARWDKNETKPYSVKQLKSIFSIYGKIDESLIEMYPNKHCAMIAFHSIQSAQKACADDELESDFGLTVTFAGDRSERKRIEATKKWSQRRPKNLTLEEYESQTRKRVQQWKQLHKSNHTINIIDDNHSHKNKNKTNVEKSDPMDIDSDSDAEPE